MPGLVPGALSPHWAPQSVPSNSLLHHVPGAWREGLLRGWGSSWSRCTWTTAAGGAGPDMVASPWSVSVASIIPSIALHFTQIVPQDLKGNPNRACTTKRELSSTMYALCILWYDYCTPITALAGPHCAPNMLGHPRRCRLAAGVTGDM